MEIIRLRKINNLDPKECCGMKKRYIKLSVIFLMPVVLLVLVLSGVATIVKAKSLIKYYDTVCQYNYEKIMSTIYNMDKSTNVFLMMIRCSANMQNSFQIIDWSYFQNYVEMD